MRIEIISIGEEILKGSVINTNATFLSQTLLAEGWLVDRHTVIPDQPNVLKQVFKETLDRSEIVISTGGLGPTVDDITRQVMADLLGVPLVLNQEVFNSLKERYNPNLLPMKDQASVPQGAVPLENIIGTVPGMMFSLKGKYLFLLPGVPSEMKAIFLNHVIPYLRQIIPRTFFRSRSLYFCMLSEQKLDPHLKTLKEIYPLLNTGIYPGYGKSIVLLNYSGSSALDSENVLTECENQLRQLCGSFLYSTEEPLIEKCIQDSFISKNETLAVAESCTGGLIASKLTQISGSSHYFLGGIVAYSNPLKENLLNVQKSTLMNDGAVSPETACEMALGIVAKTGATWGLAITGIAGPTGGSPEKPIGTAWGALVKKGFQPVFFQIPRKQLSQRKLFIEYTSQVMIASLWRLITFNIAP